MDIYTIYRAVNKINDKSYIGFTKNFDKRKKEHKKSYKNINSKNFNYIFYEALRKYEWENFEWNVLYQSKDLVFTKNTMEKHFIVEYNSYVGFKNSNGYNMTLGGDGFDSETASKNNFKRVKKGIHPFSSREDGKNLQTDRVERGIHHFLTKTDGTSFTSERTKRGENPFLKREDGSSVGKETNEQRIENKTHNFLKNENGNSVGKRTQQKLVFEKTHHFLKREDGTSIATDMVKNGTHPFLTRKDGTSIATDMVKNGTHPFLKNKNMISCYNKQGEFKKISCEDFYSQKGQKEDMEWVTAASKEGKRRVLNKIT